MCRDTGGEWGGGFEGVRRGGGAGFRVKKATNCPKKTSRMGLPGACSSTGLSRGFGGVWGDLGSHRGFFGTVLWCEGLPCPKIARFYLFFRVCRIRGGLRGPEGVEGERALPSPAGNRCATTGHGLWGKKIPNGEKKNRKPPKF